MARFILGQAAPAASTNTNVYTVPSGKSAVVTIQVCNRSTSAVLNYDIIILKSGDTLGNKNYLAKSFELPAKAGETVAASVTLGAGDKVDTNIDTANGTVMVFGDES